MDWNGFLNLASKLAAESEEASKRTAVSRAYYALFNQVKEWYESDSTRKLTTAESDNLHVKVWQELENSGKVGRKIANTGQMLRKQRNKCDYNKILDASINLNMASKQAAPLAADAIKDISSL